MALVQVRLQRHLVTVPLKLDIERVYCIALVEVAADEGLQNRILSISGSPNLELTLGQSTPPMVLLNRCGLHVAYSSESMVMSAPISKEIVMDRLTHCYLYRQLELVGRGQNDLGPIQGLSYLCLNFFQ